MFDSLSAFYFVPKEEDPFPRQQATRHKLRARIETGLIVLSLLFINTGRGAAPPDTE
jgi:hypothetical protein